MNLLILMIMTIAANKTLNVESPAFANKEMIPAKYTCTGANTSPELSIKNIPKDARSLALIVSDPDAPGGTFYHWLMWNIPVTDKITENSTPGTQGKNGKNEGKYMGPCPPSGTHHYHFNVFALDTKLDLTAGADQKALMEAMENHTVATGELIGLYKK